MRTAKKRRPASAAYSAISSCKMKTLCFPYGKGFLEGRFDEQELTAVLQSHLKDYEPRAGECELVEEALAHPAAGPRLSELVKGKKKIVIIASDHTRPVPSRIIMPMMLREIRKGNPEAQITILIATGCHRPTSSKELLAKFGPEIVIAERICVHDCDDEDNLLSLGQLPSGAELRINRLVAEADFVCAEGFIEPHFFAGFSGGRKSILPGICARKTVMANHCAAFIEDPHARTGLLDGNPIHRDMVYAAQAARLGFICNVVLDASHRVIYAVAGEPNAAHSEGVSFLRQYCRVERVEGDIVLTTNGGYPLDQNIYQSVKGMTAAEACVREGGVIIMMAASGDGHGGQSFYETFRDEKDLAAMRARFLATPAEETIPDQWQSQIFNRVLSRARVIYLSEAPDELVRDLQMIPAHSVEEAMALAVKLLSCSHPRVVAIPDGVSVMVE